MAETAAGDIRRRLAILAVIVIAVTAAAALIIALNNDEPDEAASTATTTTTDATTTTRRAATTTTAAVVIPETPDDTEAVLRDAFENSRESLAEELNGHPDIESANKVVWDDTTHGILLDVTSTWASPDNQAEGAFNITRDMAPLWGEGYADFAAVFVPTFTLVNSGTTYSCPGQFMLDLADARAGRTDFEGSCV